MENLRQMAHAALRLLRPFGARAPGRPLILSRSLVLVTLLGLLAGCMGPVIMPPKIEPGEAVIRHYNYVLTDPDQLYGFMRAFPKGGDLHNHLSGAVAAESYIAWAIAAGDCIDRTQLALAQPPCTGGQIPASAARDDKALYHRLVEAYSMQDFVPDGETGHDHFFATFDKFSAAEAGRDADMIAEAANRAANDHVLYLELMISPGMPDARRLAQQFPPLDPAMSDQDFAAVRAKLLPGIDRIVANVRSQMDAAQNRAKALLHCDVRAERRPGCDVTVRYLAQIIRVFPPTQVFAEDVLAFRLVESDPRFVGLNIVGREDDAIALHDYSFHMRMFRFLHERDPGVSMSLHAGELVEGQRGGLRNVRPEDLRFHIKEAVEIAGAERIGHGVDILNEDNAPDLLKEMAAKRVLVEINLTSNDQILRVSGSRHPFMEYRKAGVPTALSTDDEGVERIDLTHEYVRAARDYHLSYDDFKSMSRNSLEFAFVPGASLWRDPVVFAPAEPCAHETLGSTAPTAECGEFLDSSEKARLEWRLEAEFARFEQT
jgi:adenosine deaminase